MPDPTVEKVRRAQRTPQEAGDQPQVEPGDFSDLAFGATTQPTAESLSLEAAFGGTAGSTPASMPPARLRKMEALRFAEQSQQRALGLTSEEIDPSTGQRFVPDIPERIRNDIATVMDMNIDEGIRTQALIRLDTSGVQLENPTNGQPVVPFTAGFVQARGREELVGGPFPGLFLVPFQFVDAIAKENLDATRAIVPSFVPGSTKSETELRVDLGFAPQEAATLAAEADPLHPAVEAIGRLAFDPLNIGLAAPTVGRAGVTIGRGLLGATARSATAREAGEHITAAGRRFIDDEAGFFRFGRKGREVSPEELLERESRKIQDRINALEAKGALTREETIKLDSLYTVRDAVASKLSREVEDVGASPGAVRDGDLSPVTPAGSDTVANDILPPSRQSPAALGGVADDAAEEGVAPGVQRALDQGQELRNLDEPGVVGRTIESVQGPKDVSEFVRPANSTPDEAMTAFVGETGTRAEFSTAAFTTRRQIISQIDNVFGKGAARGGHADALFIGTEDEQVDIVGTVLDIAQRPHLYDLSDAQAAFLGQWQERNAALLAHLREQYNAPIGEFAAPPGGTFLSNVDVADDMLEALDTTASQQVLTGRAKTRVFETAADRMKADPDFVPETDIVVLQAGMDDSKAVMAAREVFRQGGGGLTRVQVIDLTHPGLRQARDKLAKKVDSLKGRLRTSSRRGAATRKQIKAAETKVRQANKRAEPMLERVDELGREYGPELSFLSGQIRELELIASDAARRGANLTERHALETGKAKSLLTELSDASAALDNIRDRYAAANLKGFELVREDVWRYFPVEDAKAIRKLRQRSDNSLVKLLDDIRGTAFAGDLSPILGVQLPLYSLFAPKTATKALIGAGKNSLEARDLMRSFRKETMAKAIDEDPEGYRDLAFYSGMTITGDTPREFTGGLLRFIPGFTRANEAMFAVVQRQMKAVYDNQLEVLLRDGLEDNAAKAVAADMATKVIPMWNPARLGLSSGRAAAIRAVPTSVSFLLRPAALAGEATTGLAKMALRQPVSAQEKMAVRLMLNYAAATEFLAITSASVSALLRGDDPWLATKNAIDPRSTKFGDLVVGSRKLPLGGPFRGLIRMIVPREVEWAPVPVPFANIGKFIESRIGPGLQAQYRLVNNRDFQGGEIRKGHFPEQVLRTLLFEAESVAPLTLGSAISGVRRELSAGRIAEEAVGQFAGTNLSAESPWQARNVHVRQWAEQRGITTGLGEPVESYFDLMRADRDTYDAENPDEANAIKEEQARQVRQGIPAAVKRSQFEESTTVRLAEEAGLVKELNLPVTNPHAINEDQFRERYARIQAKAAVDRAAVDRVFQLFKDTDELPEDPNKRAIVQYYDAFDKAKGESGRISFDVLDDIMAGLEAEWTDAQEAAVERNTGIAKHAPLVQEFLDDRDTLQPYFNIVRDMMDRSGLRETYRQFLRSSDRTRFRKNHRKFDLKLPQAERAQQAERESNIDVERLLYKWGYIDTPTSIRLRHEINRLQQAQGGEVVNRQAITDREPVNAR